LSAEASPQTPQGRGEERRGGREGGSSSFALGRKKRKVGAYARSEIPTERFHMAINT